MGLEVIVTLEMISLLTPQKFVLHTSTRAGLNIKVGSDWLFYVISCSHVAKNSNCVITVVT